MATEEEFRPDEFGVEANGREQFRLVWKQDTGEQRTVILDRQQLFAVLLELQKQTELESVAPTDLEELLSGEVAQVTGLGFAPASDHFRLTAFVEVPEKEAGVAISLRLSKADLKKCVSTMTQWLAQQGDEG